MPELIDDERFDSAKKLMARAPEAGQLVADAIASKPYAFWLDRLQTLEGQWAPNNNALEVGHDPQVRANGYIVPGDGCRRPGAGAGGQSGAVRCRIPDPRPGAPVRRAYRRPASRVRAKRRRNHRTEDRGCGHVSPLHQIARALSTFRIRHSTHARSTMPTRKLNFPVFDADNHMYETPDALTKFLPSGVQGRHSVRAGQRPNQDRGQGPDQQLHPEPDVQQGGPPGAMEIEFKLKNPVLKGERRGSHSSSRRRGTSRHLRRSSNRDPGWSSWTSWASTGP